MSLSGCYWHVWLRRFAHGGTALADTEVSRGFDPRSLDSDSRVLTVTPIDHLNLEPFLVRELASHRRLCWSRRGGDTGRACCSRPCSGPNRNRSHGQTNKARRPAQEHKKCRSQGVTGMFGSVDSHMVSRRSQIQRSRADLNRDRWIQSPEC